MEEQLLSYLEGCKKNDSRYQELFYTYCFKQLMKICLRYHRNYEDATASFNKAMLTVFTKIHQYRKEGSITGWTSKIITNTCLNELRNSTAFEHKEITEAEMNSFHIDAIVFGDITQKEILNIVQELPEASKLVFNLFVMEGFTHKNIADTLNISIGTSKWHLNNARTILKEKFYLLQLHESNSHAK